ncbi:hypothetical protein WDZ92_12450 [Nostoc sp. NIES-2111]
MSNLEEEWTPEEQATLDGMVERYREYTKEKIKNRWIRPVIYVEDSEYDRVKQEKTDWQVLRLSEKNDPR